MKEFEHECEKCTTSSCLWSSKEGNRCIGLSYLMNLLRVILGFWDMRLRNYLVKKRYLYPTRYLKSWHKVLTLASKKKRREKRKRCLGGAGGGVVWRKKCSKLPNTISGFVPWLVYHKTGWPPFRWTLSLSKLFILILLIPWKFDNLFFDRIFKGVVNDFETNWFNKMLTQKSYRWEMESVKNLKWNFPISIYQFLQRNIFF